MSGHTPGPWRLGRVPIGTRGDYVAVRHLDRRKGAISGTLALVVARASWRDEAKANARLIVAAPDMLSDLKLIASCECDTEAASGSVCLNDLLCRTCIARAAIAKAEGK